MNENKENYMGIFYNEKQDVSHINNEVKKEKKISIYIFNYISYIARCINY